MSRKIGEAIECLASKMVAAAGCTIIERNYYAPCGEIDLIASDGDVLVFIEVKYRKRSSFGGALASISTGKQQKLVKTARHYLVSHKKYDKIPCRFDVICVEGNGQINWIKNAFSA